MTGHPLRRLETSLGLLERAYLALGPGPLRDQFGDRFLELVRDLRKYRVDLLEEAPEVREIGDRLTRLRSVALEILKVPSRVDEWLEEPNPWLGGQWTPAEWAEHSEEGLQRCLELLERIRLGVYT